MNILAFDVWGWQSWQSWHCPRERYNNQWREWWNSLHGRIASDITDGRGLRVDDQYLSRSPHEVHSLVKEFFNIVCSFDSVIVVHQIVPRE